MTVLLFFQILSFILFLPYLGLFFLYLKLKNKNKKLNTTQQDQEEENDFEKEFFDYIDK